MYIDCTVKIGDIINFLTLLLTFCGVIFAGKELRQGKNINRANIVKELYIDFYNDNDIMKVFYDIEYDDDPDNGNYDFKLHNTDYGRKVDKLLSYFEVICDIYYRKIITKKDMRIFSYEMFQVYNNLKIQSYFAFIEEWQKEIDCGYSYEKYKKFCERESKHKK